jgi:hypothetical protein
MLFKIPIVLDTSVRAVEKAEAVAALYLSERPQWLVCPVPPGHCPYFFNKFAMVSCAIDVSRLTT